jgi:hypothetical protein
VAVRAIQLGCFASFGARCGLRLPLSARYALTGFACQHFSFSLR